MELKKAIEIIKDIDTLDDTELQEAYKTVLQELERLQKENELARKTLIENSNIADERNDLLVEIQKLKKENEDKKTYEFGLIVGTKRERDWWQNKIREKIEELEKTGCTSYDSSTADYVQSQRIGAWQALTDLIYEVVNLKEE